MTSSPLIERLEARFTVSRGAQDPLRIDLYEGNDHVGIYLGDKRGISPLVNRLLKSGAHYDRTQSKGNFQ